MSTLSYRDYCNICEDTTAFIETDKWLRDNYICSRCKSIPRNRALIETLNMVIPSWKSLTLHEFSACGSTLNYMKRKCVNYTYSHYFLNIKHGDYFNGIRCEDLEDLTFKDNTFDLVITQDVFEHVNDPYKCFSEISRVLKPSGYHIFTVPHYKSNNFTTSRTFKEDMYHGNPIDSKGSLVTYDYGTDLPRLIYKWSGRYTNIISYYDRRFGLDGEFLDVFISH